MALVLQNQVLWLVYKIDSGGAVAGKPVGRFTATDNQKKAQQWAESNRKMWNVNKKTKIQVFRQRPKGGD